MYQNQKVVVVLPAYNAAKTLERTYREIPFDLVDEVILVDDGSTDNTIDVARNLGVNWIIQHEKNKGYGGNQKSCYRKALETGSDIIIMLHPDYQYPPKLIRSMVSVVGEGLYPVVFGSRILGNGALRGGMPLYKYLFNRLLTFIQNLLMGEKLSEYHTGFRAFSANVLRKISFSHNSDGFIFDNEIIAQIFYHRFEIAEMTCPTSYFEEASSIKFTDSVVYGWGVLRVSFLYFLTRIGLYNWKILGSSTENNMLKHEQEPVC